MAGSIARAAALAAALLAAASCGTRNDARLARRVLETFRKQAGVKPLPVSALVRLKLSGGRDGRAEGTGEIEWDDQRYRETLSSGGLTVVRGIQGGKAYLTDEDGVTRVVSEPVLSDLSTRSYFWRRSYLFQDLGGASSVGLGPSSPSTVGIRLTPHGGNSLLLTFSRDARRLLSARSTGFAISFASPTRFRDESLPGRAFDAEIRWMGLPTGSMEDATAGGWLARWTTATAETPLGRSGHGVQVEARLSGVPVKLAIDASCDGPMRARSSLADRLSLAYREDVLWRPVARGAALEIGSVSFPSVSVERSERVPGGADAAAGAVLFREAIVELDPAASRLRLHDPARWAPPEGFYRAVLDDDGDRPVAILARGPRTLRLLVPTASDTPLVLETTAAARLELSGSAQLLSGLRWGAAHLPPVAASTADLAAERERGEDGLLGFDLLLRGRVFLDLPHRWAYIAPPQP